MCIGARCQNGTSSLGNIQHTTLVMVPIKCGSSTVTIIMQYELVWVSHNLFMSNQPILWCHVPFKHVLHYLYQRSQMHKPLAYILIISILFIFKLVLLYRRATSNNLGSTNLSKFQTFSQLNDVGVMHMFHLRHHYAI